MLTRDSQLPVIDEASTTAPEVVKVAERDLVEMSKHKIDTIANGLADLLATLKGVRERAREWGLG